MPFVKGNQIITDIIVLLKKMKSPTSVTTFYAIAKETKHDTRKVAHYIRNINLMREELEAMLEETKIFSSFVTFRDARGIEYIKRRDVV